MKPLVLTIFLAIALRLVRSQGGGGPSSFGYDASSACSKPYSRAARARFQSLPCDFRQQNWCTVAGSAYPWHAVRRFVQENQGLMRRMYGDERHINILRTELEKNDIEIEFDDRYHRFSEDSRQFQYEDEYEFEDEERELFENNEEAEGRGFTSRAFEDVGSRRFSKFPKLGEYTRPHFRPTGNPTTTTTTSSTSGTTGKTTDTSPEKITTKLTLIETVKNLSPEDKKKNATDNVTTTPTVTLSQIANIQNLSINEIPGQLDRVDINVENLTELPILEDSTVDEDTTVESGVTVAPATTIITDRIDEVVENDNDPGRNSAKEPVSDQVFAASEQQQFRPRPEYRPTESKPEANSMEGQLYQDVAAKDQAEPVLKLRGVNACPVKEEVVAPFWANNTRGEVLALLNLYPFEQYVHWEKCTHENKQMYCREGCRCEQQYRLHRLLAYDPNNECRGIFSDWFKFPSCCVCRCYDLPVEFRVTSRSPRMQRQRLRTSTRMSSDEKRHDV
ncbi:protein spaetzle 4 isoform X2 [Cephus cinctus]|uniref:Protein spaetzle 4 isoform X2 n=1 Tax=Cephus cinctus TaxID=211228 RepID=A0AAJ7C237_CEPCN|nr:protein spaetzle 4 isoform X2 [Cephus cinctus]